MERVVKVVWETHAGNEKVSEVSDGSVTWGFDLVDGSRMLLDGARVRIKKPASHGFRSVGTLKHCVWSELN